MYLGLAVAPATWYDELDSKEMMVAMENKEVPSVEERLPITFHDAMEQAIQEVEQQEQLYSIALKEKREKLYYSGAKYCDLISCIV